MFNAGIITCDKDMAKPVVVGKDTVYIHTDIEKIVMESEQEGGEPKEVYRCKEVQYSKDEYIEELLQKNRLVVTQLMNVKIDNLKLEGDLNKANEQIKILGSQLMKIKLDLM